jgi:adenylate cyclase
LSEAYEHLEQTAVIYDSLGQRFPQRTQDPGVLCRSHASLVSWLSGQHDRALRESERSIVMAKQLEHPFSLGSALAFAALLHQWRGEPGDASERAQECIRLGSEQHFTLWEGMGHIVAGWATMERGGDEEGRAQMNQGLALLVSTGTTLGRPAVMGFLAVASLREGLPDDALALLDGAIEFCEQTSVNYWLAELHRLRGEAHRSLRDVERSDACFCESLAIATDQGAKALALRAALSRARLHDGSDQGGATRAALQVQYEHLGGGLHIRDLRAVDDFLSGRNKSATAPI